MRAIGTKVGLALIAAQFLLSATSRAGAPIPLTASADSYVQSGSNANKNYGTSTTLSVFNTSSTQISYAFLKFDTTSVGSSIASAKLRFNAKLLKSGTLTPSLHAVPNSSWLENGITYNTAPPLGSVQGTVPVSGTQSKWYEIDVTSYIVAEKSAGHHVVSVALKSAAVSTLKMTLQSRESTSKPQLVVTMNNIPPSVSMIAPLENSKFVKNSSITLTANASDSDGTITKVDFYNDAALLGTVTSAPYSMVWNNSTARVVGSASIYAKATDNSGAITASSAVHLVIDAHTETQSANNEPLAVLPVPPAPLLPAKGSMAIDPTFGNQIVRITDSSIKVDGVDNSDCGNWYSYWPTLNANSTRLIAFCYPLEPSTLGDFVPVVFNFDPMTMVASDPVPMPYFIVPSTGIHLTQDIYWSGLENNRLFVHSSVIAGQPDARLWSYDIPPDASAPSYTAIKDFSAHVPAYEPGPGGAPGTWYGISQMSKSIDDNVFAFTIQSFTPFAVPPVPNNAPVGYLVWRRSTDTVLLNVLLRDEAGNRELDEVHVDKSGQYLTVGYDNAGVRDTKIWSLNPTPIVIADLAYLSGFSFVHYAHGTGTSLTGFVDSFNVRHLGFRHLATPTTVTPLITYNHSRPYEHYSMLADNEGWGVDSQTIYPDDAYQPFSYLDNEIFQAATQVSPSGIKTVRRLAHHQSVGESGFDSPRANISRDGRFISFTSNWGVARGRRDLYVLRVPPAP